MNILLSIINQNVLQCSLEISFKFFSNFRTCYLHLFAFERKLIYNVCTIKTKICGVEENEIEC